jgi:hypothetical protein
MFDSMQECARVYMQVCACLHTYVRTRALYTCTRDSAHVTRCARTCVSSGNLQGHQKCTHVCSRTKSHLKVNRRVCVKALQPITQLYEIYGAGGIFIDEAKNIFNLHLQIHFGFCLAELL